MHATFVSFDKLWTIELWYPTALI